MKILFGRRLCFPLSVAQLSCEELKCLRHLSADIMHPMRNFDPTKPTFVLSYRKPNRRRHLKNLHQFCISNWPRHFLHFTEGNCPTPNTVQYCFTCIFVDMLYATDTLPLSTQQTKRLKESEMKMCRWKCGFTRKAHVRSEGTRDLRKVEHIKGDAQEDG